MLFDASNNLSIWIMHCLDFAQTVILTRTLILKSKCHNNSLTGSKSHFIILFAYTIFHSTHTATMNIGFRCISEKGFKNKVAICFVILRTALDNETNILVWRKDRLHKISGL